MTYRDDLDAAQARADALQARVDELEAAQAAARIPVAVAPVARKVQNGFYLVGGISFLFGASLLILSIFLPFFSAGIRVAFATWGVTMMFLGITLGFMSSRLTIAGGDEAYLISGGKNGPRILAPGQRRVLLPILEQAQRLDLLPVPIQATLHNLYTDDHAPVDVALTGVVRITRTQEKMLAAAERFLGADPDAIAKVAQQTLESAVRSVVAQLSADRVRKESAYVSGKVIELAQDDLARMGLEIDELAVALANAVG